MLTYPDQNPKRWIPSFYFVQGMLFSCIIPMSIIMYKNLHTANALITLLSSLYGLPWMLKPTFAPIFEMILTKRKIVIGMQVILATLFIGLAMSVGKHYFFPMSVALLSALAFCAAIHDVAADGFFLQSLTLNQRTRYISLTNFFFHFSRIPCSGLLIMLVGFIASQTNTIIAWRVNYLIVAGALFIFALYHYKTLIESERSKPLTDLRVKPLKLAYKNMLMQFAGIENIKPLVILLLIYNVAEGQLLRVAPLFLLDKPIHGGLGFSTAQVGIILGGFGIAAIMLGTLLAGLLIKRYPLKTLLLYSTANLMVFNAGYLLITLAGINNIFLVTVIIMFARLAFGLSITIYVAVLIQHFSTTSLKMSVYSIGTSIMYMGMILPGAISGWVQSLIGYQAFFMWITALQLGVVFYCKHFSKET